jgi:LysR family hydrogen peroxide-inducible transcriptional activator
MVILPSLQQLRFLCALAEQCHFGPAAESCAVTQSTLSGEIKELEARLGVTLFERSHRHVIGSTNPDGRQRTHSYARTQARFMRRCLSTLSTRCRFQLSPAVLSKGSPI